MTVTCLEPSVGEALRANEHWPGMQRGNGECLGFI